MCAKNEHKKASGQNMQEQCKLFSIEEQTFEFVHYSESTGIYHVSCSYPQKMSSQTFNNFSVEKPGILEYIFLFVKL